MALVMARTIVSRLSLLARAARSPPAGQSAGAGAAANLSEDELRLLRKYMPEDAALMRPIPQVHSTPQLRQLSHAPHSASAEPGLARTVAPQSLSSSGARKGLSARPVNASPPAAVVLGSREHSCAPATVGRRMSWSDDAATRPASMSAPTSSQTGLVAPEEAIQLEQAKEQIERLHRDLAERDLALQRLSAAHDAGVRRQIAMQEQLNGNLPTYPQPQTGPEAGQWHALRDENDRLRAQTTRDAAVLRQLKEELGTSQRTVTALQTERQQRRDTVGVVAAERLAEKETEYEQNVRHLRQIVEAQEQQLLTMDSKAAQGESLLAEVNMLRKREHELTDSVRISHDTLHRQSALLEQADAKLTELKEKLAEATAKNEQDSEQQEAQLLDKILALRAESQDLRERATQAEAELEAATQRATNAEVRCSSLETELGQLREKVAGHESTATTLLHAHASLRHSQSVTGSLTSLCSVRTGHRLPSSLPIAPRSSNNFITCGVSVLVYRRWLQESLQICRCGCPTARSLDWTRNQRAALVSFALLQTLIGGGVSASGDDAASIRAARRQSQKSLEPSVLATELLQGLEVRANSQD